MIYPQQFRILKVMIHHIFATIIEEIALAGVFTRADVQDVAHALGVPLGKGE